MGFIVKIKLPRCLITKVCQANAIPFWAFERLNDSTMSDAHDNSIFLIERQSSRLYIISRTKPLIIQPMITLYFDKSNVEIRALDKSTITNKRASGTGGT